MEWLSNPDHWPEPPDELSDRAQDGWEPLLAIAEMAGGDWPGRPWNAALALREDVDLSDSDEMRMLADTKLVVDRLALPERIPSARMVIELKNLPESHWRDLDQTGLAEILRAFEVRPAKMRIDGNPNHRGYELSHLRDAWARYGIDPHPLSPDPATPATPATPEGER